MSGRPSPRLRAYVVAGIVGLVSALAVGDPAPALIGSVLLTLGIVGLAGGAAPRTSLDVIGFPDSAVEGEPFTFSIRLEVDQPLGRVYLDLKPHRLEIDEVTGARLVGRSTLSLASIGGVAKIGVVARGRGWGRAGVGPMALHADSPFGMVDLMYQAPERHSAVVIPDEPNLRTLLIPLETNLHAGDLISTRRGSGSEFADIRPYRHGDDPRELNWRVSSRTQTPWVNERHPERNGDVLLLVDGQVEAGTGLEALVDRAVRMAAALLHSHARHRHRLGLITLDGLCRWIHPGMGEVHRRRLVEQLVGIVPGEVIWEAAERAVMRAARRPAMVIALTPLLDPSLAGMVHALRRGGIDICVVEIEVEPHLPLPSGQARYLGRRIWAMERDRLRDRLSGEGVPTVIWRTIDPPDVPLAQLSRWRTAWRRRLG